MAFFATKVAKVMVILGAVGLLIMIVGCIFLGIADNIVHSRVSSRMPLTAKGQTYEHWKHPKGPLKFQVWTFHVANSDAILKGEKPVVEQKGPYTYWDKREKHHIKFSDDGTVSYKEKSKYEFERSLSVGPDTEKVTVVNLAVASVMTVLRNAKPDVKDSVKALFKVFNETLFIEVSVHDLIWGYEDLLLKNLAPLAKEMNITLPPNNVIGLFTDRNDTESEEFVVYSGGKGLHNLAEIVSWGGQKQLSLWTSDYANTMNGSLGTLFPPFVEKGKRHYFFSTDLTRTLSLDFQKDVSSRGIPLYKFVSPAANFANVTINPDNAGFCTPAGHCLPSGLLNISKSHFGAPVVASNPHFLYCDDDIKESIKGMEPNELDHESYLNIEPLTGVNMEFAMRTQINIHLQKIDGFEETDKLPSLFIPTAWFSENTKITEQQANNFKKDVLNLVTALQVIKYGFIAIGISVLIIAAFIPITCKIRRQGSTRAQSGNIQRANLARWRARRSGGDQSDSEAEALLSASQASDQV